MKAMGFKDLIAACEEAGFSESITREMLWNEAYRLGRSRWHWGPMWWVDFKCEWRMRLAKLFRRGEPISSDTTTTTSKK